MIRFIKTSEIRVGMVVGTAAGPVLITDPIKVYEHSRQPLMGGEEGETTACCATRGILLDVNHDHVPRSWCFDKKDPTDGKPRWTVQGNDNATWAVHAEPLEASAC